MAKALPIKNGVGEIVNETPEITTCILDVVKEAQVQYSHDNLLIQLLDANEEKTKKTKKDEHDAFIEKAYKLFDTTTASESD